MTAVAMVSDRELFDDHALLDFEDPTGTTRKDGVPRVVRNLRRIVVVLWVTAVMAAVSRLGGT
jgi:hypothetical protein